MNPYLSPPLDPPDEPYGEDPDVEAYWDALMQSEEDAA